MAVDGWYQQRSKEPNARFFMSICTQLPGIDPDGSIQGQYIIAPSGKLVHGWNGRDAGTLRRELAAALAKQRGGRVDLAAPVPALEGTDPQYARAVPAGASVVDVFARVTQGKYSREPDKYQKLQRVAVGRDRLWILADEKNALASGTVTKALAKRIARFHLIDNTRGEPPIWSASEVKHVTLSAQADGAGAFWLQGKAHLETADRKRGFVAALRGRAEFDGDELVRFDLAARGAHWGHGPFTRGAPDGRFEVSIATRLADQKSASSRVPPQGARALQDYLRPR